MANHYIIKNISKVKNILIKVNSLQVSMIMEFLKEEFFATVCILS